MFVIIGEIDDDLILNHLVEETENDIPTLESLGILKRLNVSLIEELAVELKMQPSLTQARKNGMSGEIPVGISQQGTKKKKVWVWRSPQ